MRISKDILTKRVKLLNKMLKRPEASWTASKAGLTANIGNFHLYGAYGLTGVQETCNEQGGVYETLPLSTKRELYIQINALIKGIELSNSN